MIDFDIGSVEGRLKIQNCFYYNLYSYPSIKTNENSKLYLRNVFANFCTDQSKTLTLIVIHEFWHITRSFPHMTRVTNFYVELESFRTKSKIIFQEATIKQRTTSYYVKLVTGYNLVSEYKYKIICLSPHVLRYSYGSEGLNKPIEASKSGRAGSVRYKNSIDHGQCAF